MGEEFASVVVRELREAPHTTVTSRSSRSRISVFARSTFIGFSGDLFVFARVVLPLIVFLFRGFTGVGLIEDEAD